VLGVSEAQKGSQIMRYLDFKGISAITHLMARLPSFESRCDRDACAGALPLIISLARMKLLVREELWK
jgi:hypothetical protein